MIESDAAAAPTVLRSTLGADDPGLVELIHTFVRSLDERITGMKTAHAGHDLKRLTTLAHQLKGAGGSYGYPQITAAARAMDKDYRAGNVDRFAVQIETLQSLAAAARHGLV